MNFFLHKLYEKIVFIFSFKIFIKFFFTFIIVVKEKEESRTNVFGGSKYWDSPTLIQLLLLFSFFTLLVSATK